MPEPQGENVRASESDASVAGRGLLQALYAASKLGALWGFESKLSEEAVANLLAAVRDAATAQGDIVLRFANDLASLNDQRIRVDFTGFMAFKHIHDRAKRRGIGEISISAAAERRDVVELLKLLEAKTETAASDDEAFDQARVDLGAAAVTGVSIGPFTADDGQRGKLGPTDVRQAAIQTYFRLLFVARQSQIVLQEGKRLQPRKCKRAVHDVIDVLERGEHLILAMSQVRNYHGYGACHAANVTVLACAVGLRIGMHKLLVADLGLAAMLHETLPHAGIGGDAALRDRDQRAARMLLPYLGFSDGALRATLAVRDLHAPARTPDGATTSLFQRIVRAVCFLDNATTPAGPSAPARPVREALAMMSRDDGTRFDPTIVRALRGLLGIYPFGTVVRLDTGERAVVHGRNPHFEQPARPVVRVFEDAQGERVEDGPVLDLSKWDREANRFVSSIAEVTAPCAAFPKPADYVRVL